VAAILAAVEGDVDKSPAESGDQSPHSKTLAHSLCGVWRVLAAFAAGRLVGLPGRVQRPGSMSDSGICLASSMREPPERDV
jgi:hypothetical protein